MYKIIICISAASFFCSCSSKSEYEFSSEKSSNSLHTDSSEVKTLRLEIVLDSVIEQNPEIYYKRVSNVAVDSNGNIYLENNRGVHVYNEKGNYLSTIGRNGSGPGEFQTIHNIKIRKDSLYVYDASLARISVFNINSKKLINEVRLPSKKGLIGLGDFDILKDGRLVVGLRKTKEKSPIIENYAEFYFLDQKGFLSNFPFQVSKLSDDFILINENGTSYPPVPFDRTTFFDVSKNGDIYFAWTGKISIKCYNSFGKFISEFNYPFKNTKINSVDDFPEFHKNLGFVSETKSILGDRLPSTFPAVANFFVDDKERLWFATITSDKNNYDWNVFTKEGKLIGRLSLEKEKKIMLVQNNVAYISSNNFSIQDPTLKIYDIKWNSLNRF